MKFKFESNLDYQIDAINSIVNIFKEQKRNDGDVWISTEGVIPNKLDLTEKQILENLKEIQKSNKIKENGQLDGMDFTIEMETGTGKTYVYLRTILELNRKYGFKKFIIVVPSVAIREGVLKTLDITKKHFKDLYDNLPYNFYEYDSSKLAKLRQFARNNTLEIMITTLDSFNKATNVMNNYQDKLSGTKPIEFVKETNPILILDEPQNMESDISKKALQNLNPLFKLRYSATHKNYYNLIYRLTPIEAVNKELVKKIEVLSVMKEGDFNKAYILCEKIVADSNGIKATLELNKKQKTGHKIAKIQVKRGDDLYKKTGSNLYQNCIITKIDAGQGIIEFSNGLKLKEGETTGGDKRELMKIQIRETIEQHFQRYRELKKNGIKILSLFFIDRVSNYTDKDGFIRKTFEEEFNKLKASFDEFKNIDVGKVHNGYFSKYKSDSGMESDSDAFDLIMRDKERLLSFDEPTQFIFSHSALREGWDNPNVFCICTLNETKSEMKKRQEIGRGVRLPVNQTGQRVRSIKHNILTVVANESYSDYVSRLQQEYIDDYGEQVFDSEGNFDQKLIPPNARRRKIIKLKKGFTLNPEFKELWRRIAKKTRYSVNLDSEDLIKQCTDEINKLTLETIKIKVERVAISLDSDYSIKTTFVGDEAEETEETFAIPDIINVLSEETNLTRETVSKIMGEVKNFDLIFKNPQEFISSIKTIIRNKMKDFLVNGIKYLEIEDYWKMELFEELESYEDRIVPVKNSIYEEIIWDSEGEKTFAQKLDEDNRVKLFVKLPNWFRVLTPVGDYNPDWAIVVEERDLSGKVREKLYLVRETKFVEDLENLRPSEKQKIKCAKEHFDTLKVDFKESRGVADIL